MNKRRNIGPLPYQRKPQPQPEPEVVEMPPYWQVVFLTFVTLFAGGAGGYWLAMVTGV